MNIKNFVSVTLFLITFSIFSQDHLYSSLTIDPELKKNANAVVRLNDKVVTIESQQKMTITLNRIVTVLNEKGNRHLQAIVGYDNYRKVKKIEAVIFNESGKEIKKIKKRDFIDHSAVDGGTLYSDSRMLYMPYTPIAYPYTVKFYCEVETPNTIVIPSWQPIEGYFLSIEKDNFIVNDHANLGLRFKELSLKEYPIKKVTTLTSVNYSLIKARAIKPEDLSPSLINFTPQVMLAVEKFHYYGVDGYAKNWTEFGNWMQHSLLEGRNNVSQKTKNQILNLVSEVKDPIEKARMVYEYVQNNTRYISVQVGIGGNQPIPAIEVDQLKYGDCKGLTIYTQSLLDIAGVTSYYTVVEAGKDIVDFDEDFASLAQGNHIILGIPNNDEMIWIDCTSQIQPFGFIGDFTDNRNVLVVKPNDSEILKTTMYPDKFNYQNTKANINIKNDASINSEITIKTNGIQYDNRFYIERESKKNIIKYYKNYWSNINNLEVLNYSFNNNKSDVEFTETVNIFAKNYASVTGERFIFSPNAFNKNTFIPSRYRNRKLQLEIQRGYLDEDEFQITIPEGYEIEAIPNNISIKNKFGEYVIQIESVNNKIIYSRKLLINKGDYPKEEYESYRNFRKKISKTDNSKIVLKKTI